MFHGDLTLNFLGCFSILGMNIFGCKFCREYTSDRKCISNRDEDKDRKNFDSLLWSLVTVFQVLFSFYSMSFKRYLYGSGKYKLIIDIRYSNKTCLKEFE